MVQLRQLFMIFFPDQLHFYDKTGFDKNDSPNNLVLHQADSVVGLIRQISRYALRQRCTTTFIATIMELERSFCVAFLHGFSFLFI